MLHIIAIILIVVGAITVITFLAWKNNKDKKLMNPGSQDSVEETIMDKERRRDKI